MRSVSNRRSTSSRDFISPSVLTATSQKEQKKKSLANQTAVQVLEKFSTGEDDQKIDN